MAARPLLADPIANGQGFLARFLISEPPSAIGTRLRREHSPCSNVVVVAAADRLISILEHPKPTAEDNPRELEPRHLPLSAKSKELLWQFYTTVEQQQGPGGDLEQITAFASKAPEQADRLRRWILETWPGIAAEQSRDKDTILPRDVVQYGPGSLRETKSAKKCLTILADHGWLVVLHPGTVIDGSPRKLSYGIVGA